MRKDNYRGVSMKCVVCTNPIPADRKWDAITCSKECSVKRKEFGRSRKDQIECRYCLRPSTPEERARYNAWRRWEKQGLTEEQTTAKLLREVERLKRKVTELEAS
jgi:predicted nucleic acid-binding Zn ribbon protein